MTNPFYLIWRQNGTLIQGYDGTAWVSTGLTFPIIFPGTTTDGQAISLQTSAAINGTFETLISVGFYLVGSDVPAVQNEWPYLGDVYTPTRPEMSGGFEISFDGGSTWTRFSKTVGVESNRSTWIPLSELAIGSTGIAGQLGAFDAANLLVRYVVPPQVTLTKVLDIQLAAGFEVA